MLFPKDNKIKFNEEYKRLIVTHENTSERFQFKAQHDYSKQFAHIYASRLTKMRELLTIKAEEKWGKD